jgi:hypothetical protein
MTRDEVAAAAGLSPATFKRREREGFQADEIIRVAGAVGASPTAALVALGVLDAQDVRGVAALDSLAGLPELALLEELLDRARLRVADVEPVEPVPAPGLAAVVRLVPGATSREPLSDLHETIADAADDAADWEREDEERERD